jgi:hypothetical protein
VATVTHIDESLLQVLTADAEVAMQAGSRIYQVQAPQGTAFPCIVFNRDSQLKTPFTHMLGAGNMIRATYTFSCISDNLLEVRNLTRAVKSALQYKSTSAIRLASCVSEDDRQNRQRAGSSSPSTARICK